MPRRVLPELRPLPALALLAATLAACDRQDTAGAPSAAASGNATAAELVVFEPQFPAAPDEVDLGHLAFGDVVSRTVHLRNVSDRPLTLRSIQPGCSCTTPQISFTDPDSGEVVHGDTRRRGDILTLPPGVVADLEFTVDTTIAPTRNRHKLVVVRITTDSEVTPFLTLNVRLLVVSYFAPAPALIDLRQVAVNGGGVAELGLVSDNEEGRRIVGIAQSPLELVPELTTESVFGAEVWKLRVRLLPPIALGFQEREVVLATSGPGGQGEGPPLRVKVRATGVPDVSIEPAVVLLSAPPEGGPAAGAAQVVLRVQGQTLAITSARLEGLEAGRVALQLSPQGANPQGRSALWDLRLEARGDLGDETLSGALVLETDDPQHPRVEGRWLYRP